MLPEDQQRTPEEIHEAVDQIIERRWYGRTTPEIRIRNGKTPEDQASIASAIDKMEAKYGRDDLQDPHNYTDHNWGYFHGIQSALMWVLGGDWGDGNT